MQKVLARSGRVNIACQEDNGVVSGVAILPDRGCAVSNSRAIPKTKNFKSLPPASQISGEARDKKLRYVGLAVLWANCNYSTLLLFLSLEPSGL